MNTVKWAFNSATVKNLPWPDELKLLEQYGWSAAEVWYDKFQAAIDAGQASSFAELARQMRSAGVEPVGACVGVLSTLALNRDPDQEMDKFVTRLDFAADINAGSLAVVVVGPRGEDVNGEYDSAVSKLHRAGQLAAERDLRLSLEFLGGAPFNGCLGSCIDLIERVNLPNVGMLFDLVHYYISASHIEDLSRLSDGKLFRVHVDDVPLRPMEALTTETRCLPGQGRINVPHLIQAVQKLTQYDDVWAVEIYDPLFWERPADEVFPAVSQSLKALTAELTSACEAI